MINNTDVLYINVHVVTGEQINSWPFSISLKYFTQYLPLVDVYVYPNRLLTSLQLVMEHQWITRRTQ